MPRKIILKKDTLYACPNCNYQWEKAWDLAFDEDECVPCCPECGELIEDGDDGGEYV